VPKIVLLDWLITGAPPPFVEALEGMQSAERWRATVDRIFGQWLHGVDNEALDRFVKGEMGAYGFDMWARAAREIAAAYAVAGSPLEALTQLVPPLPVLHLYGQPADPSFFETQQEFARQHPWFHVQRLNARSHFPMFEVPEEMAEAIETFAG
jgi:pimeloyl-ACP methyl ester carboxylesterase